MVAIPTQPTTISSADAAKNRPVRALSLRVKVHIIRVRASTNMTMAR